MQDTIAEGTPNHSDPAGEMARLMAEMMSLWQVLPGQAAGPTGVARPRTGKAALDEERLRAEEAEIEAGFDNMPV